MSCNPPMDEKERQDCIHYSTDGCTHPNKGHWCHCKTMHTPWFDKNSCQPGWYQTKKCETKNIIERITMSLKGIYYKKVAQKNNDVYLRLIPASTYDGSVAVEAVNERGERLALVCRISKEQGIQIYEDVPSELGFPMRHGTIEVQEHHTC